MIQEEIKQILKKKSDTRGAVFQTDANYILNKEGEAGLKKMEAQLNEWGIPFSYKEIEPMGWYPVSWRVLSLLATKETLGFNDEEIREMGKNAPKASIIVKLFFKLFPDIEKFAKQIPNYWRKHYTAGELAVASLDKEKKELILHLKDFSFHPFFCKYLEGYFEAATKITRPKDSIVTSKEISCSFRKEAPYEEYQLKWTS